MTRARTVVKSEFAPPSTRRPTTLVAARRGGSARRLGATRSCRPFAGDQPRPDTPAPHSCAPTSSAIDGPRSKTPPARGVQPRARCCRPRPCNGLSVRSLEMPGRTMRAAQRSLRGSAGRGLRRGPRPLAGLPAYRRQQRARPLTLRRTRARTPRHTVGVGDSRPFASVG
jgi:hypothetical protein